MCMRSLFAATVESRQAVVEYEPDAELRDNRADPAAGEGGIKAFLRPGQSHADRD